MIEVKKYKETILWGLFAPGVSSWRLRKWDCGFDDDIMHIYIPSISPVLVKFYT